MKLIFKTTSELERELLRRIGGKKIQQFWKDKYGHWWTIDHETRKAIICDPAKYPLNQEKE